ncbi:MAG: HAD family hydrolase [Desulfobacterales bacterium]|nr:HAD family hydrolase [Desulfobacterales bacterium]
MLKAVLFDLDNTMILFDETSFYQGYIRRLGKLFADIMSADQFLERLIGATRSLSQNAGQETNKEYFQRVFSRGYENRSTDFWDRFLYFYEFEYDKIEADFSLPDGLHETMERIVHTGVKLVLASNPVFPRNAQLKRFAWTGLDHLSFDLVTHMENMSFCKPRLEYYLGICKMIDELPEDCLMVGNDPVNDMVAALAGMKTFLTDDRKFVHNPKRDRTAMLKSLGLENIPPPDFTGPFARIPAAVQELVLS